MNGQKEGPIGLLDSGVGGLTVAKEIVRFLPRESLVYFGDTLHLPYGPKKKEDVRRYVFEIIDFLIEEKGAKVIVLACNTATAFTLEEARRRYPVPIFGTLSGATKKAIEITNNYKIGVIGTEGTVNSQAYQESLFKDNKHLEVYAAACPGFVDLVEEGKFSGREVKEVASRYLYGLKRVGIDTLILGCTHYPYLIPVIQEVMGDRVRLVNPALEMAREVEEILRLKGLLREESKEEKEITQQEFLVSDRRKISEKFLKEGSKYLRLPSLNFKEKNIFYKGEENV